MEKLPRQLYTGEFRQPKTCSPAGSSGAASGRG